MRNKYICLLMIITVLLVTGCSGQKKITINACKNCAFSFYDEEFSKKFDENYYLRDFTYDYNELKTKNGENRKMFLGHILNGRKIERGFACGINNDKVFCIEGTKDGSKYEDNVQVLKDVFGDINCKEDDYFIFCKDDIFAGTNRDGTANVGVLSDGIECNVISNGTMTCS